MDLLFKREQKTGWIRRRVNFKLWAKAEFTDEEQALITKYRMDRAMLVPVPTPGLLRTAIIVALITFPIAYLLWVFVIWPLTYLRISFYVQLAGCAMASLFVAFAYYHQKRETIYVKDLLHGRYFKCRSVIELARKEAYLESINGYFRQVIESAKHWGGTDKRPIEPLPPEEAKNFILSGPFL